MQTPGGFRDRGQMSWTTRRVGRFLGLERNVVLLLCAIMLIGAGEETWMRFLPKYLEVLGASVFAIGLFDALKTLIGALYAYPGGVLSDRWGRRRALLFFTSLSLTGYALVLLIPHWAGILAAMFLFLAWSNLSLPASFSMVAGRLPAEKHSMGIGVQSLLRRLPVIVGPAVGGLLLDRFGIVAGVRVGVTISIVLGALALAVQRHYHAEETGESTPGPAGLFPAIRRFSPDLKRLLLSDILIRFCERIPFAWIVIHAMDHLGIPAFQVGVLISVEMIAAIVCYIPASHLADRYGKEPFVIATFVMFTMFPLAMLWARTFPGLLLAFAVRGLKEFGEPARKALIIQHAPAETRGRTIGAYYLLRDTLVTSGSFLGAALWEIGPEVNFGVAFALGAVGTVAYSVLSRRTPASS